MTTLILAVEGKIKPFVRANKRMGKRGSSGRIQYEEYKTCKDVLASQAMSMLALTGQDRIPDMTEYWLAALVEVPTAHTSDIDNILKTILDALSGVLCPDDRWCMGANITKQKGESAEMNQVIIVSDSPINPQLLLDPSAQRTGL